MSQEKVDRYKKEKANRKQTIARNKIKRTCGMILGWVIVIGIVGWAGYSGYRYYEANKPEKTIYCDLSDLSEYITSLNSD